MNNLLFTLMICVCSLTLPCSASQATKAREVFEHCSRKQFLTDTRPSYQIIDGLRVPLIPTGHTADLGNGDLVGFDTLEFQAVIIARNGIEAFEEAFQHLDDKDAYMRCIAFEALVQITEVSPDEYFFGKPGGAFIAKEDWCERAKRMWREWKTKQSGAGEPPAKSADRVPPRVQAQIPSSKDGLQ